MLNFAPDALRTSFGFGVAGNFAGHLEQAGEAVDFVHVEAAAEAPKGIFPWYAPGAPTSAIPSFLHTFPVADQEIAFPAGADNLQIEPEVGLIAEVHYGDGGQVTQLTPTAVGAFNDCSIRRPNAAKISEKKNWGAASKGAAARYFPVSDLAADTTNLRLASFLVRDKQAHAYGVDSAVSDYSYYGTRLLDWIVERLANQQGAAETPLEPVGAYLQAAGKPGQVLVGIGATRYTEFGESTYLQPGDDSVVVLYDATQHTPEGITGAVAAGTESDLHAVSHLRQRVNRT
ncbi:MAG: hypothetical protein J2O48_06715 [Solirubrobacterales bacterium]|nr:hypothetical protein [Solirubrobacterales bacterium]